MTDDTRVDVVAREAADLQDVRKRLAARRLHGHRVLSVRPDDNDRAVEGTALRVDAGDRTDGRHVVEAVVARAVVQVDLALGALHRHAVVAPERRTKVQPEVEVFAHEVNLPGAPGGTGLGDFRETVHIGQRDRNVQRDDEGTDVRRFRKTLDFAVDLLPDKVDEAESVDRHRLLPVRPDKANAREVHPLRRDLPVERQSLGTDAEDVRTRQFDRPAPEVRKPHLERFVAVDVTRLVVDVRKPRVAELLRPKRLPKETNVDGGGRHERTERVLAG